MIKICDKHASYPLKLTYEALFQEGIFPDSKKKANIVLKKDSKNLLKNYRSISFLPVFAKIFERLDLSWFISSFYYKLTFYKLLVWFLARGFLCFSITSNVHEINLSFDFSPGIDIRGVFLDISTAFDKVWHQRLIFKLKLYRAEGTFLGLMINYLHGGMQRVVLNGQCFSWELIQSGVPQGRVLGPLNLYK